MKTIFFQILKKFLKYSDVETLACRHPRETEPGNEVSMSTDKSVGYFAQRSQLLYSLKKEAPSAYVVFNCFRRIFCYLFLHIYIFYRILAFVTFFPVFTILIYLC